LLDTLFPLFEYFLHFNLK